ncbi:polysaccharide deacetylase family protein [Thermosynechococcus sp. FA-CM-4201]
MVASLESTVREISPQAIARELALRLAPQATYVRVAHSTEGWKILLEAEQIPDQRTCLDVLVAFLSPVLPQSIDVYGRQLGGQRPAWGVRLRPRPVATPTPATVGDRQLEPLALVASVLGIFGLGAVGQWQSPSVWLAAAPEPTVEQVRSVILNAAPTLAPARPPLWHHYSPPEAFRGRVFNRVALPPEQKLVALTFDDGPDPTYTPQVLDILAQEKVKGTFFAIARAVAARPELAQRIVREGHVLANHSWSHGYHSFNPGAAQHEVDQSQQLIADISGANIKLFRPPGGNLHNGLVSRASQQGYGVVMWSVDPQDWFPRQTSDRIVNTVVQQAHAGAIVLLHDGGGSRRATVAALPRIIAELRAKGYQFVTVPELIAAQEPTSLPEPPSWLTIQETAQLQQLILQLETRIQALEKELKTTPPWAIAEREYLAATLREQQAALSWVQQRLAFEQAAEGQYQAALKLAEQATLAAKAQQASVAKTLWQQAIATLDTIPNTAFVAPLAQIKQRQYSRRMHQLQ